MAKKTHIKVRLVPEVKPDSSFFTMLKNPQEGEKAKVKLKVKKYNPSTSMKFLLKKNFLLIVNNYFFLKFLLFEIYIG